MLKIIKLQEELLILFYKISNLSGCYIMFKVKKFAIILAINL